MKIKELTDKWVTLTFDGTNSPFEQSTSVCLIRGKHRLYLLDTHTGPVSMEPVLRFAKERFDEQWNFEPIVVFNSHSDWDHVWGNCAFPGSSIISHTKCREFMAHDDLWDHSLKLFDKARNGEIIRQLPQVTFQQHIDFPEDGLRFFHSPGHTEDSSSVYDKFEGILFVGDNLELPLPYLQSDNLKAYLATLDSYLKLDPTLIVTSHSGVVSVDLIKKTKVYLTALVAGEDPDLEGVDAVAIHKSNIKTMNISRIE